MPFSYMHEGSRYFAFADLMFDILDEEPRLGQKLAFARMEDIHGLYDRDLLNVTFDTLKSEGVPASIAHIPLFMDPYGTQGYGTIKTPNPSTATKDFAVLVRETLKDSRNALVWHGATHQLDNLRNPGSGASGDDYEFWDMAKDRPVKNDTVEWTINRLATALPVFDELGVSPRYWVTPHYQGSAISNRVFGAVFPWVIGRVTYYPTSVGPSFTLPATSVEGALAVPAVSRETLDAAKEKLGTLKDRSSEGLGQLFPFEIYRDVYGQRIIPETLGYLSISTEDKGAVIRDVANVLADAQRNLVIRDYWASFFFHPYIFSSAADGGGGRYYGDTGRLRQILIGLKGMGYRFTSLGEFEASLNRGLRN